MPVQVHLVDGTYELFRSYHSPRNNDPVRGAVRGAVRSVLSLLQDGATHVGVATDHVIESFRNDLWPAYKSSAGLPAALLNQFEPLEEALSALGVVVWPMVELEADDALAAAARVAASDPEVDRVVIVTPDKDLAQCVVGQRVVQWDRMRRIVRDEAGVRTKFGVGPAAIPDWLALIGDSADGYPGLPGFGAKTAAALLSRWGHIDAIPPHPRDWGVAVRDASSLAAVLAANANAAALFRELATLVADADLATTIADLRWPGPSTDFIAAAAALRDPGLALRAHRLADGRPAH